MTDLLQTLRTCHDELVVVARRLAPLELQPAHASGAVAARQMIRLARQTLREHFPNLAADLDLDSLLEAEDWEYPTQIIDRCDFSRLLRACEKRIEALEGPGEPALLETRRKLARAVRIEEAARKRRERDRQLREKADRLLTTSSQEKQAAK